MFKPDGIFAEYGPLNFNEAGSVAPLLLHSVVKKYMYGRLNYDKVAELTTELNKLRDLYTVSNSALRNTTEENETLRKEITEHKNMLNVRDNEAVDLKIHLEKMTLKSNKLEAENKILATRLSVYTE